MNYSCGRVKTWTYAGTASTGHSELGRIPISMGVVHRPTLGLINLPYDFDRSFFIYYVNVSS